jgi:CRP/FNR family cyclic AMP-dependent transcriptional regulator
MRTYNTDQPQMATVRGRHLQPEAAIPVEVDDLWMLAKRYADQGMFDESIHLYEMAAKLKPGSVGLRMELARVQDLKREAEGKRYTEVRDQMATEFARDAADASQAIGLAEYYVAKDQSTKAIELLEIAKIKTPNHHRAYEVLARLYFSQGEWLLAQEEAQKARTLNPFNRELAELSGRIEFELKDYPKSLEEFVDAFLLSTDQKGESAEPIRRMINTLKRVLTLDNVPLNALIKERVEHLQTCTEKLELRKDAIFRSDARRELKDIMRKVTRDVNKRERMAQFATDLRRLTVLQHMRDEQLQQLSKFVQVADLDTGEYLFRENDRSMDFYVVKEGGLEVRKETPFGPQLLAVIGRDHIVGEMNFIDRMQRSTDAIATEPATCYAFSFSALDLMMDHDKELAVALHWAFWRSLAEKVRDANEQLKLFFQEESKKSQTRRGVEGKRETAEVRVKSEDKVDLFRERGLSAAEMKLLATFSSEERFRAGSTIFREGEVGDALYIVLDGRVRISKFIPGVGEEALTVLDRGDFFGEMALIDDKPRSADAKAHEMDTTVLSVDRSTLNEILSMDPRASLQFLNLLCRMISRRLREINDKIVQWKYMSGGF